MTVVVANVTVAVVVAVVIGDSVDGGLVDFGQLEPTASTLCVWLPLVTPGQHPNWEVSQSFLATVVKALVVVLVVATLVVVVVFVGSGQPYPRKPGLGIAVPGQHSNTEYSHARGWSSWRGQFEPTTSSRTQS